MLAVSILDRRDKITRERCGRLAARLRPPSLTPNVYTANPDLSGMAADLIVCLLSKAGYGRCVADLCRDRSGRLLASSPGAPPYISIAHDGDLAVVAVGDRYPLGVDVQKQDTRDLSDLADAVLCRRERERFERLGAPVFFEAWTRREAALKSIGASVLTMREFETEDGFRLRHGVSRMVARNIPSPDRAYSIALALAIPPF